MVSESGEREWSVGVVSESGQWEWSVRVVSESGQSYLGAAPQVCYIAR